MGYLAISRLSGLLALYVDKRQLTKRKVILGGKVHSGTYAPVSRPWLDTLVREQQTKTETSSELPYG